MDKLKPYLLPGAGLLAALVLAFLWNLNHRARVSAEREAEEYKLRLKNQIVATEETTGALKADVDGLLRDNALLRKAVEDAKAAAPGAQPIGSASLSTGQVRVLGTPPPPASAPVPVGEVKVTPENDLSQAPPRTCALHEDDLISLGVKLVTLQTREKNYLVAGVAEAWRETPPRALLGTGPFTSALSDVDALAPPPEPRWGAMALGLCTEAGCGPGAALLLPPVRAFGIRWEGAAGLVLGPQAGAFGGVGARW